MKIIIAAPHYPPHYIGGTEQIAYRTAHALQGKGHEVSVVCVESIIAESEEFCIDMEMEDGVKVHRLFFKNHEDHNYFQSSYQNEQVRDWLTVVLREEKPDIVHLLSGYLISASVLEAAYACQTATVVTLLDYWFVCPRITLLRANGELCAEPVPASRCAWCMLSRKRRFRVPDEKSGGMLGDVYTLVGKNDAIAQVMGLSGAIEPIIERRKYLKKMLEQADVVISHSNFLQKKIRDSGIFADNFVYLPNGIEDELISPSDSKIHNQPLRIGYIGQIAQHKGVHVLVNAFMELHASPQQAELDIYGDGSRWPEYSQSLRQMANGNFDIHFKGPFPAADVAKILDGLDLLVVPSVWFENRPTVILDAFARKKPVIVSDMGGMAEMVVHDQDGLRFRPGDAASLRQQLRRVLDEPDLLARLAAGIQPVKAVRDEIDEIEQLYQKVLRQRQQMRVLNRL